MPDLNIDSLVAPLASDGPCGANLEYEPAFEAMQQASTIRPETQYGDKITPAQPADWPAVRQHALMLAERTRDLRVVVFLIRAEARVGTFETVAQGQPTEAQAADGTQVASVKPAGSIESRDDAIRALQRVCDWLERNEPSHPAPLLIARAQRLLKKNFMEIIKDLVPDGLGQIEKLAGPAE